jgi:nucleoside-diphosphate-sugar epimerase
MKTALVIGGTGPTGPFIVNGMLERGYKTAVLNRGVHDTPEIPSSVERIVGDPHFQETLAEALKGRTFDVVIATYGRIRYVADVLTNHTGRLITIGGSPGIKGNRQPEILFPEGQRTPTPEDAPRVATIEEFKFGYLARISEDAVFEAHAAGHYVATHFRYPLIYGPRQLRPAEWHVMQRIKDGRPHIVLPDSGLTLISRGYSRNMAEAVLLAVDQPERASGQLYHCGDVHQLTLAQWVQVVAQAMDCSLDVISVPGAFAYPARDIMINRKTSHHQFFDLHKIRAELGYVDLVPTMDALRDTVQWYLNNPPQVSAQELENLHAHYATEDAMVSLHGEMVERLSAIPHIDPDYQHPYAHPKKPGQGGDHRGR